MKVKVTIEETISQTFELEIHSMDTAYDEIRATYKNGEIVEEEPSLLCVKAMIHEEDGTDSEFVDLQI